MRIICICVFLCFTACISVHAQIRRYTINGRVLDEKHSPIEAVTIALLNHSDSSFVKSSSTQKSGVFIIKNIKPGEYDLLITKMGNEPVKSGPYHLTASIADVQAGNILLKKSTTSLNEIVVTDRRSYLDVRADKTIINVSKSILATGASVYDVLGNTPGIKLTEDGEVLLKANQKALVLINGKAISTARQDLDAVLRSLQSASVDRIEVIPNPPANYEAMGTGGVVNIILSKGKNEGLNGSATAMGGYGRYGKYSEGINLNYRNNKLNVFGGLSEAYNKTYREVGTDRMIGPAEINSYYCNNQRITTFQYNAGADYAIDSAHTIGIALRGNYNNNNMGKGTISSLYSFGSLDSSLNTQSQSRRHYGNYNYNLNYSGTIGHTGQIISLDADYTDINRRSFEYFTSGLTRYVTNGNARFSIDSLRSIAPLEVKIKSVKADYTNPLSKKLILKAGAKISDTRGVYNQEFDIEKNGNYYALPVLSNNFTYHEQITSAYASLQKQGGAFSYNAGLRMEHTYANVSQPAFEFSRKYTNFFPSVQFTYHANANHQLLMAYSYRITQPDYEDLNPNFSFQDRYNYLSGNPYLQPAYINSLQLSDTYKSKYVTTLYAERTSNFFGFSYFFQDDATQINITTRQNLKREQAYGIRVAIPVELVSWWNINFSADGSYQRYADYFGGLNKGTKDFIFDLTQSFKLNKFLSADVAGHYESATFYGTNSIRPYYYVNAGVSSQLSKAASLTLTATDVFNTRRDRYASNYLNSNLSGYTKPETQVVRLTFTYRFGKGTVKGPRSHTAGNAEEVRRAVNGN